MDDAKKTEIERWFIKADHDLQTSKLVLNATPPITDAACFHAQQVAEKSLKAFLVFKDCQVKKTHDLIMLLNACVEQDGFFEECRNLLKGLTRYATVERYPDDWREIPFDEAQEAVKRAEECMAFVKTKVAL